MSRSDVFAQMTTSKIFLIIIGKMFHFRVGLLASSSSTSIFRCFKPVLSTFTHAQREILQSRKEKLSSSGFSFVRGYFFRCLQRRENYNFKINKTVERNVEENPRRFSQSMKKNFKVFLAMCFQFFSFSLRCAKRKMCFSMNFSF